MDNRMRTIYRSGWNKGFHFKIPWWLNKKFGMKLPEIYWLQQKLPEEGWRVQWPKCCECNCQDQDNCQSCINKVNKSWFPSSYRLNSTIKVLPQRWLWHQVILEDWYAIKQRNPTKLNKSSLKSYYDTEQSLKHLNETSGEKIFCN